MMIRRWHNKYANFRTTKLGTSRNLDRERPFDVFPPSWCILRCLLPEKQMMLFVLSLPCNDDSQKHFEVSTSMRSVRAVHVTRCGKYHWFWCSQDTYTKSHSIRELTDFLCILNLFGSAPEWRNVLHLALCASWRLLLCHDAVARVAVLSVGLDFSSWWRYTNCQVVLEVSGSYERTEGIMSHFLSCKWISCYVKILVPVARILTHSCKHRYPKCHKECCPRVSVHEFCVLCTGFTGIAGSKSQHNWFRNILRLQQRSTKFVDFVVISALPQIFRSPLHINTS